MLLTANRCALLVGLLLGAVLAVGLNAFGTVAGV